MIKSGVFLTRRSHKVQQGLKSKITFNTLHAHQDVDGIISDHDIAIFMINHISMNLNHNKMSNRTYQSIFGMCYHIILSCSVVSNLPT